MEETNDNQVVNMLTEVEQADSDSSHRDVTVDKETSTIVQKEETIIIESKDRERRNSQIEAAIEIISTVKKAKEQRQSSSRAGGDQQPASNMNGSYGLVLNPGMISLSGDNADNADSFIKVGIVLGKGNSCGEVIVVKDKVTKQKVALKTIPVSYFNGDEIRAWVKLADEDMAPELYHVRLINGKVEFSMKPLAGLTMEQANDCWMNMHQQDPSIPEKLSLWVLRDLLEIHDKLQPFSHGDIHAGNVYLENSMTEKMIDFGSAKNSEELTPEGKVMAMRFDLLGIIRIFCVVYSGVDFDDVHDATTQLKTNDLSKLSKNMPHITEASRQQLFEIMLMLYDTVRDPKQAGFGDTSRVAVYINHLLPEDVDKFKKKVAVILFPEKYQIEISCVQAVCNSCGQAFGTSCGQAVGTSCGQAVDTSCGQSVSTSCGQAVGTSCGQAVGTSRGQAVGTSRGQAVSTFCEQAVGTSWGQSVSTSWGQSVSTSWGQSVGNSWGQAVSTSCGQSVSNSWGQSVSTSWGQSVSTSCGQSVSTSWGQSVGTSCVGTSCGQSVGTSWGQSVGTSWGQSVSTSCGQSVSTSCGQC